jgi:hypothetical protein
MRLLLLSLSAGLLLAGPSPGRAQRLAPAGVQRNTAADPAASAPAPTVPRKPSASKYVWRGALIGAVALGAIAYVSLVTQDEECLGCSTIIIVPVVLGTGAILGAAVGYGVYRVRRSRPAT